MTSWKGIMQAVGGAVGSMVGWVRRGTAAAGRLNRERRRRGYTFPLNLHSKAARLLVLMLLFLGILVGALAATLSYLTPRSDGRQIAITDVLALAGSGQIRTATIYDFDHRVAGEYVTRPPSGGAPASGSAVRYWATLPPSDIETPTLIDRLSASGAVVGITHQLDKDIAQFLADAILPLAILANLFGLIFLVARGGGGDALGGVIQFGRIGRRRAASGGSQTTFADVAGADEAVTELREVRDYLRDPQRFTTLGAQPPKGVLLMGPPGCGKTLLARAVAGEADVPFFSISGAEFVESLVGIGAARVRDLFRQVRSAAPAIVFIDELDAAGRRRGSVTGGQEEREQTLNQLLVEMDGFEPAMGIVVMGATNRPDILDPALLRPGRFDRQVTVEPPDLIGRQAILELHASRRPMEPEIDFEHLARRCPGFTGADLANVVNEAALLSVRAQKSEIGMEEFEEAVQRVLTGPRRRGHLLTANERKRAAFHEAGHAVIAASVGRLHDVQRVSIIARGRTLGQTAVSKTLQERALLSSRELRTELICLLGGVAAEEMVLGDVSTGSEGDLERANGLAQLIAGRYGMSDKLGKVQYLRLEGSEFLGGDVALAETTAGPVLMELHQEVRRLLETAEGKAMEILGRHREVLEEVAQRLETEETLETSELEVLLEAVRPEVNLAGIDFIEPPVTNGSRPHALSRPATGRD